MTLTSEAYAKINLTLDVLGKRSDGYHDISSVMKTVSLHDTLVFSASERSDSRNDISITCDYPFLPCEETNLCYKACQLFLNEFGIKGYNIGIEITKRIPIAAGLGGGSSDCAETLKALDRLFGIGAGREKLITLAASLGADVPFFIDGGCALAEGIGERLYPIAFPGKYAILLAKPSEPLFSGQIYSLFDRQLAENPAAISSPTTRLFLKALDSGGDYLSYVSNMLASATVHIEGQIRILKALMKENGALCSEVTGSGPTVYGLFAEIKQAEQSLKSLKKQDFGGFCGIFDTI